MNYVDLFSGIRPYIGVGEMRYDWSMRKTTRCPSRISLSDLAPESPGAAGLQEHLSRCPKCAEKLFIARLLQLSDLPQAAETKERSADCPADVKLQDFVTHSLTAGDERHAMIRHLSECSVCRKRSVQLLRQMELETEPNQVAGLRQPELDATATGAAGLQQPELQTAANRGAGAQYPGLPASDKWLKRETSLPALRWLAVAMLVLGVGVGSALYWRQRTAAIWIEPAAELRDAGGGAFRHFRLDKPAEGARISRGSDIRFTWPEIPAADKYFITIYDAQGTRCVEETVTIPEFRLPSAHGLQAAGVYLWGVQVRTASAKLYSSEMRSFMILQP